MKGGLHREEKQLSPAATSAIRAALRELQDGQERAARLCMQDISTEELQVARPLMMELAQLMDQVEASRVEAPMLPLGRTA